MRDRSKPLCNERRYLLLGSAISLLFFISAGWVVFDALFMPFKSKGEVVEIGNFCGINLEDASFSPWLEVETEYRYDPDKPAGVILSQSPAPGSRRRLTEQKGTCPLTLVVSLGEETAVIPDVLGKDAREAEAQLRQKGFAVERKSSVSAYPSGTVYDMSPRVGVELPVGSSVTLFVSEGVASQVVSVPDLRGKTRSEALVELWMAKLEVGEVVEEPSLEPEGTVLRQSHQAGTLVLAGTKVTFYVAAFIED